MRDNPEAHRRQQEEYAEGRTLMGKAKRWLKLQTGFHGDPRRGHHERQQAQALEHDIKSDIKDKAAEKVFMAVLPRSWRDKLEQSQTGSEQSRQAAAQRRTQELAARPRVRAQITFSGALAGTVDDALAATFRWPDREYDFLVVEFEAVEPIPVSGHTLLRFSFGVPGYRGPGTYDLSALASGKDDGWDYTEWVLAIDDEDEPHSWHPTYGPGFVTVDEAQASARVQLVMDDPGGRRINLDAVVGLQPPPAA